MRRAALFAGLVLLPGLWSSAVRADPNDALPIPPPQPRQEAEVAAPDPTATPPPPHPSPADEVTVLGGKLSRVAGSAHVLRKEHLDRQRYDDPHQILTAVPGVYVRGEDGFGLRPNIGIRGAASDRSKKLTLMEDGVLFGPAPYSAPAAYYFPLMARMRAVRVVKGPAAIAHGPQTVGGSIDLLTREIPATRQGMLDLGIGQFGFTKLHLTYGASDERAGFLIEGVRLANSGFKTIDGNPGANTGFVRNEWMAKGSRTLDLGGPGSHELWLKVGYSDEVSHETYLGLTDEDFRASPYRRYATSRSDRMDWYRTQLALTHRATYPGDFSAETTVYRHSLHRVWSRVKSLGGASILDVLARPTVGRNRVYYGVLTGQANTTSTDDTVLFGPNDRRFLSQGAQTTLRLKARTGSVEHQVEYGLRFHYDEIQRLHSEDAMRSEGGALLPSGNAPRMTDDNRASTRAIALHAMDQIGYRRLLLTPGVRIELIQPEFLDRRTGRKNRRAYQVFLPGVGSYLAITRDLGVLAGVYKGFSPAPPESTPITRPEESINYEAGLRYDRKKVRAEVIGFFNDYKNLTDICTFSNGCLAHNLDRQFDAGAVHIYGIETFAEATIPTSWGVSLPVRAAYTLTRTRFRNSFIAQDSFFGEVVAGDELPYVPRHQASGGVGIETSRWGVNVAGTYVGSMREQAGGSPDRVLPDNAPRTDDYFLLDASASYKVIPGLTLYLNGRNWLDSAFIVARRPFGARPNAPRWVQAGVQLIF
ncbi:MAG: TonB-dependent receptor [Myxococcales bacterium]|nr:TonB-dependent receptor [Polyangiaceae bacterium]MDW8249529.1 TonB-dependent receptor [Myxococcales bacterium]